MPRNCFTCARATDQGDAFACRWTPGTLLQTVPFYPVVRVSITRSAVSKDKIPNRDCPGYKAPKEAGLTAAVRPASEVPPPTTKRPAKGRKG